MKKHDDDWEEFLKQRESEKVKEEAELKELIDHDNGKKGKNTSKVQNIEKQVENSTRQETYNTFTEEQNKELDNLNEQKQRLAKIVENAKEELDDDEENTPFDINTLSEKEILGEITSSEIAKRLYEEASKKYDEAFESWEVDPDNEELQLKLDQAEREHEIALKRLNILQKKEIKKIEQDIAQIKTSSTANTTNNKGLLSRAYSITITLIVLAAFFGTILLSANGYGKYASALFPCTMVILVFASIFKFFMLPQIKHANRNVNDSKTKKQNNLGVILSILVLIVLAACLFITIFGSCLKNKNMIIGGIVGFVGLIIIMATITKIKSNKNKK